MAFNPEVARRRKARPTTLNAPATTVLAAPSIALNDLDSEESREALSQIESWFAEQCDYHAENRREQMLDSDFYDHEQWDPESMSILAERNQAALTFNLIAPVINWIVGTERRTRVDWGVFPRSSAAQPVAEVKEKLLKFISDTSGAGYERSKAFKDQVIAGVGWTREYRQVDPKDGPPVMVKRVDWKRVRWDPYSRDDELRDCRSISVEQYVDLDYAIAMFPDRAENLRAAACRTIDPTLEFLDDDTAMPQMFWGQRARLLSQFGMHGTTAQQRRSRPRVRLIETEYRRPVVTKRVRALADDLGHLNKAMFDPQDADMAAALKDKRITIDDAIEDQIWVAIWHPGFLCSHERLPYRHNRFTLTPYWCYRRHRDGMPYGIVRGLRDPQEEYNKRRSKALFALSTNRIIYEAGAIEEGDEDSVLEEVAKPNGQIRLADGGLAKVRIDDNVEIADAHIKLLDAARQDIHEGSSITPENQGLDTKALSGVAIRAKQQQGAVGTAEVFDNYRRGVQLGGVKTLSLCEQYLTAPMEIRITGDRDTEFLTVNQPLYDPATGQVIWENDITADQADFVVDEEDYRETTRQAQAEMLFETVSRLPPEVSLKLLDLVIDLSDIPNREEFVARIKQINGQAAAEQPATPEELAAQQQQQAAAQEDADLSRRERAAKVAKDEASANKLNADARAVDVATKGDAMRVAGHVALTPGLAPAADRLANPPAGSTPLGPLSLPPPQPGGIQVPTLVPQPET